MRKLAQNIYFKPYFCLPDTYLANTIFFLPAVSRKISHKFSDASHFEQINWLGGLLLSK